MSSNKTTSKKTIVFRRVSEIEVSFEDWWNNTHNQYKIQEEDAIKVWEIMCRDALEDESKTEIDDCGCELELGEVEGSLEDLELDATCICECCDEYLVSGWNDRHNCGCKLICKNCIEKHDVECKDYIEQQKLLNEKRKLNKAKKEKLVNSAEKKTE